MKNRKKAIVKFLCRGVGETDFFRFSAASVKTTKSVYNWQ